MAVKTINQKITLSGGDEIARSLRDLARLGEEAFRQLGQAAAKIDLNLPLEKVKAQLQDLARTGQQAFTQLGQSAQQAIAPINEVGNASQRAAQGVAQVGQSAQTFGAVKDQASVAATAIGTIGTAIKIAAASITGFAATIGGLAASYIALANSATKAALAVEESARKSGQSVQNYQQLAFMLERLGLSPAQATTAMRALQDQIGTTASGPLRDLQRQLTDTNGALIGWNRSVLGHGVTYEAVFERIRRTTAEAAREMQALALNGRGAFTDVQRLLVATGAAFDMMTGEVREGIEPWRALAEIIRNMPEDKARQLLGKFLPEDIVNKLLPALRQGSAALEKILEDLRLVGGFSEEDIEIAKAFQQEFDLLQRAIRANKNELGLLFAPALTPIVRAWTESIRANRAEWLKLATALRDAVLPIITKVTEFLTRRTEGDVGGVDKIIKAFRELGAAIEPIYNNIIKPAFTEMARLATLAATEISRAFGDEVTPTMVALGVALTFLLGPIKAVGFALLALFGGDTPALNKFREKLKELGIDIDAIKEKFRDLKEFLASVFRGEGEGFNKLSRALNVFGIDIDQIQAKLGELWEDIQKIFAGDDKDIKNQWLVDLKEGFKEFAKEIGPALIAGAAFVALLIRVVGPANAARLAVLQFTGILNAIAVAAVIASAAMFTLLNAATLLIRVAAALGIGFAPFLVALAALGTALVILASHIDTVLAAFEGFRSLSTGNLDRAQDAFGRMGIAAKQLQAGVEQLRRDLEKDPDMSGWQRALSFAWGFIKKEFELFARELEQFLNQLEAFVTAIARVIDTVAQAITRELKGAFDTVVEAFKSIIATIVSIGQAGFKQLGTLIVQPFTDAFNSIRGSWNALVEYLTAQVTAFAERLRNMLPSFLRGAEATPLPPISPEGQASFERMLNTVEQISERMKAVGTAITDNATKTKDLATKIGDAAAKAGELAAKMGEIAAKAGAAADKMQDVSEKAVQKRQGFSTEGFPEGQVEDRRGDDNRLLLQLQGMVEFAESVTEDIQQLFSDTVDAIVEKFTEGVDAIKPMLSSIGDIADTLSTKFDPLGNALTAPFNQAATAITAILDGLIAKIDAVAQRLQQLGSGGGLGAGVAAPGEGAGRLGGGLGGGLGGLGQQLIAGMEQALSQLQTMIGTAITNIGTAFSTLATTLLQPFYNLLTGVDQVMLMIRDVIAAAFAGMASASAGLEQTLLQPFYNMLSGVDQIMSSIRGVVDAAFGALSSSIASAAAAVESAIAQIIASLRAAVAEAQALAAAAQQAASAAASAGSEGGFARGGYTGDVGTRRVAGVVHGGEYVEPAHVVRQPGVRAFLETLRRVGDLREAIRRFSRGFSVGGFVDNLSDRMSAAMMPGFASGGMVPAPATPGRDLGVLRLDAGGEMLKVMTDQSTAFKLQRFARRQQMTSGGRAPIWER